MTHAVHSYQAEQAGQPPLPGAPASARRPGADESPAAALPFFELFAGTLAGAMLGEGEQGAVDDIGRQAAPPEADFPPAKNTRTIEARPEPQVRAQAQTERYDSQPQDAEGSKARRPLVSASTQAESEPTRRAEPAGEDSARQARAAGGTQAAQQSGGRSGEPQQARTEAGQEAKAQAADKAPAQARPGSQAQGETTRAAEPMSSAKPSAFQGSLPSELRQALGAENGRAAVQAQVAKAAPSYAAASAVGANAVTEAPAESTVTPGGGEASGGKTTAAQQMMRALQGEVIAKGISRAGAAAKAFSLPGAAQAAQTGSAVPGGAQSLSGSTQSGATARSAAPQLNLPVPSEKVFNQVIRAAQISVKQGSEEIRLLLKPENLGWIKVKVTVQDGQRVTARVVVENSEVKSLLESNIRQLHNALQGQGLRVGQLVVDLHGDGDRMAEQSGRQQPEVKQTFNGEAFAEAAPEEGLSQDAAHSTGDYLIDLTI